MQGQTASYVLTTLVTAPASANLTTLANAKDDLDIPSTDVSNDSRLTRYITEESAAIARYCNRIFGLATWADEFRPQHGVRGEGVRAANNPLKLNKWPLAAKVITFTGNTHASTLVDGLNTTAGLASGQLMSGPGIPAGATIASVNVGASSLLLSVPATAAATAVPLSTGISVVETAAGVDTGLTAGTDFEIDQGSLLPGDEGAGCLYRLNQHGNPRTWPAAKIVVVYQAGYSLPNDTSPNLPSDLEGICLRIVVGRYQAKGRDPLLVEQSQGANLGTRRYWVGAAPGQKGPYPNEIMSVIDNYRVPVVS
jgi:hypothetical protein